MRDHYDFSNGIKNPYADKLKKQITIHLDDTVIDYFKNMAEETGMPLSEYNQLLSAGLCKRKETSGISIQ